MKRTVALVGLIAPKDAEEAARLFVLALRQGDTARLTDAAPMAGRSTGTCGAEALRAIDRLRAGGPGPR